MLNKQTNLYLFFIVLIGCSNCSESVDLQQENVKKDKFTHKQIPIAGNAYLRFYEFDDKLNLYFEPKIIINSQKFPIHGLEEKYGSIGEIKTVSPDGNYFILDLIMSNQKNNMETCAVIDIQNKMMIRRLENYCNGEWNKANQWLVDGEVIISFD